MCPDPRRPGSSHPHGRNPETWRPTSETVAFVREHLGPPPKRLLEVGCGDGAVASVLDAEGHDVTAIDADPDMVARARGRGVDARCVRWPEFFGDGFAAVAFTRSLHHLSPLRPSVRRAVEALVPGGRIVVEDLAHEAVDDRTLQWFADALQPLDQEGLLVPQPSLRANQMLAASDLRAAWNAGRGHDLHPFARIETACEDVGEVVFRRDVPYFYRHVAQALVDAPEAEKALEAFFAEETRRARAGEIAFLGRRLVVRVPTD